VRFDVVTIFPEFFAGPLDHGITRRAREAGLAEVRVHDLRRWTRDRHRTVDDRPFGGGEGMVLKPEPLFEAVEEIAGADRSGVRVILLSAAGKLFRQATARELARAARVVLLCGRYEGVDERVAERLATDELSIGDYVLSGGELAAAVIVEATVRLLPGALGNEDSAVNESFSEVPDESSGSPRSAEALPPDPSFDFRVSSFGLLDFPHYTRPQEFRGWAVPDVLVSGNHEEIRRWRRRKALEKTLRNRPDLLAAAALSDEDRRLLAELQRE
jgi:tRNA (guanine37-N1)-methyltransferase